MKTSTKIGIIGLVGSLAVQITFGIVEIIEYRKGKRRISSKDVKLIGDAVANRQEEIKQLKKQQKAESKKVIEKE